MRLQVTDKGVQHLVDSLTSLVTLNVIGCHRLTPRAKEQVNLMARRLSPGLQGEPLAASSLIHSLWCNAACFQQEPQEQCGMSGSMSRSTDSVISRPGLTLQCCAQVARLLDNPYQN